MMKDGERGLAITVYEIVLSALVFCHFLSATIIDPGKYPKGRHNPNIPKQRIHLGPLTNWFGRRASCDPR